MTLDELLLEWSYRSERGYPTLDNPSDVSILKEILTKLNLSEQDIDDVLDNLPDDEPGGDDLTNPGTDGMEDSSVEKEKEKQAQQKSKEKNVDDKEILQAKQDLKDIIDDTKEPVLNLSPDELEKYSRLIDKYDENPLKENTEEEDRYGDTQKEVKAQIDSGKLSLESLVYIQSTILGEQKKEEIYDYFSTGGKALLQKEVFGVAFEEMKRTGDIKEFVEYIKNPMSFREVYPNETGNLITPFESIFTTSFLQTLLEMDKGYSGISVGKGEYFLTLLCNDISFDSPYDVQGDLTWGNKGMEVKNAGAKPTGQKAGYGPNSHDSIFTNALRFINKIADNPTFKVKGKDIPTSEFKGMKNFRKAIKGLEGAPSRWPYKIATLYELISPENKKPFIDQVDKDLLNSYRKLPGVKNLKFSNFIENGKIKASEFEIEWSRAVVEDYQKQHDFDFCLFLNSKVGKGGYELMPSNKILGSLGIKGQKEYAVQIWAQDGLPRWTASSVF